MPLILRNGTLLLNSNGTLKFYDGDGPPPPNCCCVSSSGGTCCGLTGDEELFGTIESDCAEIDGTMFTLTQVLGSAGLWRASNVEMGDPSCVKSNFDLTCSGLRIGLGSEEEWELIVTNVTFGCVLFMDSNPASITCRPLELVFEGTVDAATYGSCTCCGLGDSVTIRITM